MPERNHLYGLPADKVRLIEKYRLVPKTVGTRLHWVREFKNRPDHPYVTDRALRRCSLLQLVFSIYDLCVAKMTYFTARIDEYNCCKFNYRTRELEKCPLWDVEFLVQKQTGIPIDLRNLAAISDIAVFREMCSWLERQSAAKEMRPGEKWGVQFDPSWLSGFEPSGQFVSV